MVPDHFLNDEAQEFLAEIGVELRFAGQFAQTLDLAVLACGVGGGQGMLGLVRTHGLGDAKPLGQYVDQRGIDIVDAGAIAGQDGIGGFG